MTPTDSYYRNPNVRRQMVRFLGGESLAEATAAYITASDPAELHFDPKPVSDLPTFLDRGLDIGRSLWDDELLVVDLDIDYVNFTFPGEAHVHPRRTFRILQPVIDAAEALIESCRMSALHLLSGCGHHLVWSIRHDSNALGRLVGLAPLPETLVETYQQPRWPPGRAVGRRLGEANAGLALIMEYLTHRIIAVSAGPCPAPVEATAVRVGPGAQGAEAVSVDISEYADPLHLRTIRIPFSRYLKPLQQRQILGDHVVRGLSPLLLIPLGEMTVSEGLATMTDPRAVEALAGDAHARIPDCSETFGALIDEYVGSRLAGFHEWFYREEPHAPDRWAETYDRTDLAALPPCGRRPLVEPNDLLVKPDRIRHVVRILLSRGWHPRHIAGLIRCRYERDYQWDRYWDYYDAASRAEAYTRLFAGLFFAGRDDLIDFNCRSSQEKGYCACDQCTGDLAGCRQALLQRRSSHV